MNVLIGTLFPLAIAVAISPVAVYAAIRMSLASPSGMAPDWGFLVGWIVGVGTGVSFVALLAHWATAPLGIEVWHTVWAVALVALGLFCFALGGRRWRVRPRPGEAVRWPAWMPAAEGADPAKALGLAFALGLLDTKNLVVVVAAGVLIGASGASFAAHAVAAVVFTLVASLTLLAVVLGYRLSVPGIAPRLRTLATGVEQHFGSIEPVVLVVTGALLTGLGVATF